MPKKMVNFEFERLHRSMGCYSCRFADKQTLGKDACCQHYQGPSIPGKGMACTRESERVQAEAEKEAQS